MYSWCLKKVFALRQSIFSAKQGQGIKILTMVKIADWAHFLNEKMDILPMLIPNYDAMWLPLLCFVKFNEKGDGLLLLFLKNWGMEEDCRNSGDNEGENF